MMIGILAAAIRRAVQGGLVLDRFPGATLALSPGRRLRTAYAGPAIRVRRSSDNSQQDIGFIGDKLDEISLLAFVGSADGYVTTVYDQSGQAADAVELTDQKQPVIVVAGVIQTLGGIPSLRFDGAATSLRTTKPVAAQNSQQITLLVAYSRANSAIGMIVEGGASHTQAKQTFMLDVNEAAGALIFGGTASSGTIYTSYVVGPTTSANTPSVVCAVMDTTGITHATEFPVYRQDGVQGYAAGMWGPDAGDLPFGDRVLNIGSRDRSSLFFAGMLTAVVFYPNATHAANPELDGDFIAAYV